MKSEECGLFASRKPCELREASPAMRAAILVRRGVSGRGKNTFVAGDYLRWILCGSNCLVCRFIFLASSYGGKARDLRRFPLLVASYSICSLRQPSAFFTSRKPCEFFSLVRTMRNKNFLLPLGLALCSQGKACACGLASAGVPSGRKAL